MPSIPIIVVASLIPDLSVERQLLLTFVNSEDDYGDCC